jgi:hypothetical protein
MGKRAWRTPIPHLSLLDRKAGQGLIVFWVGTSNIEQPTSNTQLITIAGLRLIECSMLNVGCWMFSHG